MPSRLINVKCENCKAEIQLDEETVTLKRMLGKKIECPMCRNIRIAKNLEISARMFSGEYEEEIDFEELRKRLNAKEVQSIF
jgi:uncharacterized protein YlaI